jgi:hypothetical protein
MNTLKAEVVKSFDALMNYTNDTEYYNLFRAIARMKNINIVCKDDDYYLLNNNTKIYEILSVGKIGELIETTLTTHFDDIIKHYTKKQDLSDRIALAKNRIKLNAALKGDALIINACALRKKLGNTQRINNILQKVARASDSSSVEFNADTINIQFNNGKVNLKSGELSERTGKEMSTFCLPYDFITDASTLTTEMQDVKKIMTMIFNNSEQDYNMIMSMLAYQMTGHNVHQLFMYWLGSGAGNGKTTTMKILTKVFGSYVMKLSTDFLSKNNSDRFRELNVINSHTRIVYIEEQEKELDKAFLKQFAGDEEEHNVKQLFQSKTKSKRFRAFLNILSNHIPLFNSDNGMKRRGTLYESESKFFKQHEYPANPRPLDFLADVHLLDKFDNIRYKNAFIHLLLPFLRDCLKTGNIKGLSKLQSVFLDSAEINDTFKQFLDEHFEITKNENDIVSKAEFMMIYNTHAPRKTEFKFIISDIRTSGLYYIKDRQKKGQKGVITGLKIKGEQLINPDIDIPLSQPVKEKSLSEYVREHIEEVGEGELNRIIAMCTSKLEAMKPKILQELDEPVDEHPKQLETVETQKKEIVIKSEDEPVVNIVTEYRELMEKVWKQGKKGVEVLKGVLRVLEEASVPYVSYEPLISYDEIMKYKSDICGMMPKMLIPALKEGDMIDCYVKRKRNFYRSGGEYTERMTGIVKRITDGDSVYEKAVWFDPCKIYVKNSDVQFIYNVPKELYSPKSVRLDEKTDPDSCHILYPKREIFDYKGQHYDTETPAIVVHNGKYGVPDDEPEPKPQPKKPATTTDNTITVEFDDDDETAVTCSLDDVDTHDIKEKKPQATNSITDFKKGDMVQHDDEGHVILWKVQKVGQHNLTIAPCELVTPSLNMDFYYNKKDSSVHPWNYEMVPHSTCSIVKPKQAIFDFKGRHYDTKTPAIVVYNNHIGIPHDTPKEASQKKQPVDNTITVEFDDEDNDETAMSKAFMDDLDDIVDMHDIKVKKPHKK